MAPKMDRKEAQKIWARIVAKAWADENFKKRLLKDPAAVGKEEGLPVPQGITIRVMEDNAKTRTLVLPPPPPGGSADIERVGERLAAWDCGDCCPGSVGADDRDD